MKTPIYLDSNATTQVHPEVVEAMMPYLTGGWHNPSSGYAAGKEIKAAVETAREKVASLIGANPSEVVFTGCGTESNNMALLDLARSVGTGGKAVTSEIEHSAVLRPLEALERGGALEVQRVGTDSDGRLRTADFEQALETDRPGFVSIMWANNETGVIQPMDEVCRIAREAGWSVHTDAIQAVGKIPVDVHSLPVDFLSLSGHKFHAPKGVGALYIREGVEFEPMIRGGGQELGRRSGTENVPYIVGLGRAAELMQEGLERDGHAAVRELRDHLEDCLCRELEGVELNGSRDFRAGNVAHVSFEGCRASDLLPRLDHAGIQCSAGSACMTGKAQPSHVQKAMGFSDHRAFSSLRLSLSIFSTREEIDRAAAVITEVVSQVRKGC